LRVVILIIVALILLLGGGGAAWWFLMGPGAERTTELIAEINKPQPVYVSVDPDLVISLIQEGEVTHHVTMHMTLLVADNNDAGMTIQNMARLRDAFLTELHSHFALRMIRNAGFESLLVKQRLMAVCDRLVGKGVVGNIILREVERRQPSQS
jgi:flagellar basal body-associated protein FliL